VNGLAQRATHLRVGALWTRLKGAAARAAHAPWFDQDGLAFLAEDEPRPSPWAESIGRYWSLCSLLVISGMLVVLLRPAQPTWLWLALPVYWLYWALKIGAYALAGRHAPQDASARRPAWLRLLHSEWGLIARGALAIAGVTCFLIVLYGTTSYLRHLDAANRTDFAPLLFMLPVMFVAERGTFRATSLCAALAMVGVGVAVLVPSTPFPLPLRSTPAELAMIGVWTVLVPMGTHLAVQTRRLEKARFRQVLHAAPIPAAGGASAAWANEWLAGLAESWGWPHLNIWLPTPDGRHLELWAAASPLFREGIGYALPGPARPDERRSGVIWHVLLSGRAYTTGLGRNDRLFRTLPFAEDLQAQVAVPILYRGERIGVLEAESDLAGFFTRAHNKPALAAMARTAASVLVATGDAWRTAGARASHQREVDRLADRLGIDLAVWCPVDAKSGAIGDPIASGEFLDERSAEMVRSNVPRANGLLRSLLGADPDEYAHGDVRRLPPADAAVWERTVRPVPRGVYSITQAEAIASRITLRVRHAGCVVGILFLNYRELRDFALAADYLAAVRLAARQLAAAFAALEPVAAAPDAGPEAPEACPLSPQALRLLTYIHFGLQQKEACRRVSQGGPNGKYRMKESTAKTHMRRTFDKLGLRDEAAVAALAAKKGWIPFPGTAREDDPVLPDEPGTTPRRPAGDRPVLRVVGERKHAG